MQRSAPLSSMGPTDMVPCLELSVVASKCREKSTRKVHTSLYKCVWREIKEIDDQVARVKRAKRETEAEASGDYEDDSDAAFVAQGNAGLAELAQQIYKAGYKAGYKQLA